MKTYGKIFIYELHLCSRGAKTLKLTKTHQPKIVEVRLTSAKPQSIYIKLLGKKKKDFSVAHRVCGIYAKTVDMHVMVKSLSCIGQNKALMSDE